MVATLLGIGSEASANLIALHEAATRRDAIFRWLTYPTGQPGQAKAFRRAVGSAVVLAALEPWLSGPTRLALGA